MPHSRNRRRNGVKSAEWSRSPISREPRKSPALRQSALPDDRELCGRRPRQDSAAGQRSFFLLDGLGYRASTAKTRRGVSSNRLPSIFVSYHPTALHHKLHMLQRRHILKWIAIHRDDVGPRPWLKAPYFSRPSQQVRGIHRGG